MNTELPQPATLTDLVQAYHDLRWQFDLGIDEAVLDKPFNKLVPLKAKISEAVAPVQPEGTAHPAPIVPRINFKSINTLEDLKGAVAAIQGLAIKETAMNLVFGEGLADAPSVMLIGEAPGEEEDRTGRPFVGASGQLLEKMLAAIGFTREQVYITNVLPWRPPGNRTPKTDEVAICLPYLQKHIELVRPKTLLLLGGSAAAAVLGKAESLSRLRGSWYDYSPAEGQAAIPTLVTYHPSYLLRSAGQKRESWRDLRLLKTRLK